MADFPPIARAPIAILGIVSLIAGVLSGLARLGWEVPSLAVNAVGVHGALMISAFLAPLSASSVQWRSGDAGPIKHPLQPVRVVLPCLAAQRPWRNIFRSTHRS